VVVGGSIHSGHHSPRLRQYVQKHVETLNSVPTALFQVSLTSMRHDERHEIEAHRMVYELLDDTGLVPEMLGLFAGALAYTRYGWFTRRRMRGLASRGRVDTDTTRDHEYTDWGAVEEFAAHAFEAAVDFQSLRSQRPQRS
jgi:menaquinone-dependent protoporphyrinogen oxidase